MTKLPAIRIVTCKHNPAPGDHCYTCAAEQEAAAKMSNEQKLQAFPAPPEGADFKLASVDHINHKPHPYTIGPRHVAHASDHHCGMLDQHAIESAERLGVHCAHPKCRLPFDEHTSDLVCFVEVSAQYPNIADVPLLRDYLTQIADKATELGIDGFAFVKGKASK
jgi:hypothetical protein